jgi:hypothetical protein
MSRHDRDYAIRLAEQRRAVAAPPPQPPPSTAALLAFGERRLREERTRMTLGRWALLPEAERRRLFPDPAHRATLDAAACDFIRRY